MEIDVNAGNENKAKLVPGRELLHVIRKTISNKLVQSQIYLSGTNFKETRNQNHHDDHIKILHRWFVKNHTQSKYNCVRTVCMAVRGSLESVSCWIGSMVCVASCNQP
uniref:DUF4806 domain-containing protein n=1 Tax=Loa loa TaxID=7209 RepID=A0A1I7W3N6_LOALO